MFTRLCCMAVGLMFAFALAIQCHWGTWGLVVSLCVFPPLGWILADWRGFVASLKRAIRQAIWETLPAKLRNGWKEVNEAWHKAWQDVKQFHQATNCGYFALTVALYAIPILIGVLYLIYLGPGLHNPIGDSAFSVLFGASFFLLFVFTSIVAPDTARYEYAKDLCKERDTGLWRNYGHLVPPGELEAKIKELYPSIWVEAEERTRAWSWRCLVRYNPISLPFVALWFALVKSPHAVKVCWNMAGRSLLAVAKTAKLTYLYANSDARRFNFLSIALGMIVGFPLGYPYGQPLAGIILGGIVVGLLGWLQRKFVYPRFATSQIK